MIKRSAIQLPTLLATILLSMGLVCAQQRPDFTREEKRAIQEVSSRCDRNIRPGSGETCSDVIKSTFDKAMKFPADKAFEYAVEWISKSSAVATGASILKDLIEPEYTAGPEYDMTHQPNVELHP